MSHVAKLFMNGRSQAVRLPAAFRFETDQVFIRRDERTGDVVLSSKPPTWDSFFALLSEVEGSSKFLDADERRTGPDSRDPFEGWSE